MSSEMSQHLTEEQLVLYHYGEAEGRAGVAEHLGACPACRGETAALEQVLAAVAEAPAPERGEDYGSQVWQKLRTRLPERRASRWFGFLQGIPTRRWIEAGAMAVLLLAAFLTGRLSPRPGSQPAPPVAAAQTNERILLVAVGEHLERSQMMLIELVNTRPARRVDISGQQQFAEELVEANRLYRQTAVRTGDTAIASLLDELERVLLEIAHGPPEVSREQLNTIRKRIEEQGIIFKVRVIGSKALEEGNRPAPEQSRGERAGVGGKL